MVDAEVAGFVVGVRRLQTGARGALQPLVVVVGIRRARVAGVGDLGQVREVVDVREGVRSARDRSQPVERVVGRGLRPRAVRHLRAVTVPVVDEGRVRGRVRVVDRRQPVQDVVAEARLPVAPRGRRVPVRVDHLRPVAVCVVGVAPDTVQRRRHRGEAVRGVVAVRRLVQVGVLSRRQVSDVVVGVLGHGSS